VQHNAVAGKLVNPRAKHEDDEVASPRSHPRHN
jgi:hypothetical protein